MPDALSKTVPIWCCVVNRAIMLRNPSLCLDTTLYTPPAVVSRQEHAHIEHCLDEWAHNLAVGRFR